MAGKPFCLRERARAQKLLRVAEALEARTVTGQEEAYWRARTARQRLHSVLKLRFDSCDVPHGFLRAALADLAAARRFLRKPPRAWSRRDWRRTN